MWRGQYVSRDTFTLDSLAKMAVSPDYLARFPTKDGLWECFSAMSTFICTYNHYAGVFVAVLYFEKNKDD